MKLNLEIPRVSLRTLVGEGRASPGDRTTKVAVQFGTGQCVLSKEYRLFTYFYRKSGSGIQKDAVNNS